MSSSIIVLGCPVRPIPASLIPAGTPVFLANCYKQNRVIQRSFCAAAIQSLACLLRVNRVEDDRDERTQLVRNARRKRTQIQACRSCREVVGSTVKRSTS